MSITDELRERIDDEALLLSTRRELWNIADRIDAEHESKVSYWQGASYKDGYDEGFASADDYFTDKRETLKEHGWVKLPVDADGVPIHVGDMVEYLTGGRDIVRFVTLNGDGWTVNERGWKPCTMRRIMSPTVEDVLEEFAQRNAEIPNDESGTEPFEALLAEYAAKLRLAGEDE